jgi:hypothetical protein
MGHMQIWDAWHIPGHPRATSSERRFTADHGRESPAGLLIAKSALAETDGRQGDRWRVRHIFGPGMDEDGRGHHATRANANRKALLLEAAVLGVTVRRDRADLVAWATKRLR